MSGGPEQIEENARGTPAEPSPSASIILVSPRNQILLLHRVRTSSAFPSAHVFPGGNLASSDGHIPPASNLSRHTDSAAYRVAAIRELFEESGILLARSRNPNYPSTSPPLLELSSEARGAGRKAIHSHATTITDWLHEQSPDASLDTESLIPFTHWITPPNVAKRFTTQMYLYFVPVGEEGNASILPTSDGGLENTAVDFRPACEWVEMSRKGEIILFPPQFILLHLVSLHLDLDRDPGELVSKEEILRRREALRIFVETDGTPPWKDKYISPVAVGLTSKRRDGRTVLGLEKPGLELKGTELKGDFERVIIVKFRKEGPRQVDIRWRKEVLEEMRREQEEDRMKESQEPSSKI